MIQSGRRGKKKDDGVKGLSGKKLFYGFSLAQKVPEGRLVKQVDSVVELSFVRPLVKGILWPVLAESLQSFGPFSTATVRLRDAFFLTVLNELSNSLSIYSTERCMIDKYRPLNYILHILDPYLGGKGLGWVASQPGGKGLCPR